MSGVARAFSFRLLGEFHSHPLYDHDGNTQHTLRDAARCAELVYGSEWAEVFNGDVGCDRDEAREEGLLE